ncbi:MAG TPA: hypothetical protein DD407_07615 [Pseudohongiella sp.]|nr:hypothetical protein [Gammaproteobacteria bacterium]HBN14896.1 hypothetical protein [Pseudohongiella sp.]
MQPRSTYVTVLAWIFIIFAGFATLVSLLQFVMVSIMFGSEELQIAGLAQQVYLLPDLTVTPEGDGFEGGEQFGTIVLWFSVALGIAISVLFGWIIRKLTTEPIRNEFVQLSSDDMSGSAGGHAVMSMWAAGRKNAQVCCCTAWAPRQIRHHSLVVSVIVSFFALFMSIAHATVEPPVADVRQEYQLPALSISPFLGRWLDTVNLRYNPAGAHSAYSDDEAMLDMLREAAQRWERVSGIGFNVAPASVAAPDETDVIVSWKHAEGETWAGRAGPDLGGYLESRGYFEFSGGDLTLNSAGTWSSDPYEMMSILTHELGHVLGLGHSENPNSIMFANPYNRMAFPMADDVRAVQVLYGHPDEAFDSSYIQPPAASPAKVRRFLGSEAASLLLGSFQDSDSLTAASVINDDTPDDYWLVMKTPVLSTDGLQARLDIVGPDGMLHSSLPFAPGCHWCYQLKALGLASYFKDFPGTWSVFLREDSAVFSEPELLFATSFEVDAFRQYNRIPEAKAVVEQANTPYSINVKVFADDPEGDDILVRWHLPEPRSDKNGDGIADYYLTEELGSNMQSAWQQIDFKRPGTHEFFIQINDKVARYENRPGLERTTSAGKGFQTLLKVTVTLPIQSSADIKTVSSYVPDGRRRWLSSLNGVQAHPDYQLPYQRIGTIGDGEQRLYTCVRVTTQGEPDPGFAENTDVTFVITSVGEGEIQLQASRASAPVPGANPTQLRCSGRFETSTGLYTDIIRLGDQILDVEFTMTDDTALIFRLQGLRELLPRI